MESLPHESGLAAAAALLDELRDHPGWDEGRRSEHLDRLVGRFAREVLIRAVTPRLPNLGGGDGEAVLRILEAMGDPDSLALLADALADQPGLSSERTWDALGVLEGTGLVEARPELVERRDDLEELLDDDQSIEQLAAEIDDDPGSTWLALQGLCEIEPEVRAEIIAGLAASEAGPGVVDLLRILAFAHDPATRSAALAGLSNLSESRTEARMAWASLALDHPDPAIRERASRKLGDDPAASMSLWRGEGSGRARPRLIGSAVSDVDREGRGLIVLSAEDRGDRVIAAFSCDVLAGIVDVAGETGEMAAAFFEQVLAAPGRRWVRDRHGLALALLAGSALLCGPRTSPALAYWLERTAGPGFRPSPIRSSAPQPARVSPDHAERVEQARAVLDALPDWRDDSAITYEIARSLGLRDGDMPIQPRDDPGAFRILFEKGLSGGLDLYRRMLMWMSYAWGESGRDELARASQAIAIELADPQNAVPGHPFLEALAVRSLDAAREDLRRGGDARAKS